MSFFTIDELRNVTLPCVIAYKLSDPPEGETGRSAHAYRVDSYSVLEPEEIAAKLLDVMTDQLVNYGRVTLALMSYGVLLIAKDAGDVSFVRVMPYKSTDNILIE
jgi:hypothetical protein